MIEIANEFLKLAIVPEAGCKITGLQSVKTGRQWLWANPFLPVAAPVYGASYVEQLDSGGWDEIFPSVAPDHTGGLSIPDHGDLAQLPWQVLSQSATRLAAAVTTRFAPVRFTRTLTLEGNRLQADYRMENQGEKSVPYLWCAHPLIALEPGMRIELPQGTTMRIDGGVGVAAGTSFAWPHAPGLPALDRVPDPGQAGFAPFAGKMFTAQNAVDTVAIATADGSEKLRLSWDRQSAPHLGLWLNCRGWSGCGSAPYFNLGVEPATAPFDALSAAVQDGSGRLFAPGASAAWSLTVTLE